MINCKVEIYNETNEKWENLTAFYPVILTERLDAELDSGSFGFMSKSEDIFMPFTKCKITVGNEVKYFLLSDTAEWYGGEYWRHNANLTEPTKILEGYIISGLAVTQPREAPTKTLYDVLQRLINVTPLRTDSEQPIFTITDAPAIVELLQSTYSPEFRWGSQTTLWECLSDIGAYIDAMPRLVPSKADDSIYNTITFDLINEVKEILESVDYSQCLHTVNENQYCSALETNAENLVASNADEASTVFPGETAWITPRTEEIKLTDENCQLILPSNIERLNRVWVNAEDVSIHVNWNDGTNATDRSIASFGVSELDITDLVVEMSDWQTLDTTKYTALSALAYEYYKNNTWYYTLHGNIINLPSTFSIWGSTTTTKNVLGSAAVRQLSDGTKNNNGDYTFVYGGIRYGINVAKTGNPVNIRFRVEYNALNSASKARSVKTQKQNAHFIQPFNQRAEINNAQFLGRNMQGTVDRMGVKTSEYFVQVMSEEEVLKVGSAFVKDNEMYIITSVQQEVHGEVIYVNYGLSQNWNLISQYVGIDRKFRNWNIPAEVLQRNLYDYDYCVISDEPLEKTARLNDQAIEASLNVFKCTQKTSSTEINNAWFIRSDETGAVINASSFALGNSIIFVAKTKDNLSAGMNRTKKDDDYICRDVYYTQEDGTLDSAAVFFNSGIYGLNPDLFPKALSVLSPTDPETNMPDYLNGIYLLSKVYLIDKDPAEQLTFSYQLHYVSKLSDVIIGPQIGSTSPLVRQWWHGNKSFKVWGLTKPLPHNSVKVLSSWGTLLGSVTNDNNAYFSAELTDKNIKLTVKSVKGNYVGWAITDEDNNLYIAQNKSPSKDLTLYLGFVHNY